ncbi:O-glycosyl hydrolase family 30 protein [Aphelenchoides avenae]|nr:O-glycosyl hydrolase family 30 protein [Aphelenchus avenae]
MKSHSFASAILSLVCLTGYASASKPCISRRYKGEGDSVVCVCNATYCDEVPPLGLLDDYQIAVYTTSKSGQRFQRTNLRFTSNSDFSKYDVAIAVDASKTYQEIHGFGGAFTDAAGVNLNRLDAATADQLLRTYYGPVGIEYTSGRVPIASCDFSTFEYSYCDTPDDFEMKTFSLATEDLVLKIPYIRRAMNLTGNQLKLFASPWSPPGWMKTIDRMQGGGEMKGPLSGPYYTAYAKYFVRFFEEYAKRGVPFWGVTVQNEPGAGCDGKYDWQGMCISSGEQRDFANELLGPALKQNPVTKDIKIMAHDDQRDWIDVVAREVYNSSRASYVDGLGVHWYTNAPFDILTKAHNVNPNKFLLATEACEGAGGPHWHRSPQLGSWDRGKHYGTDIIQNLLNWVTGWTDWNLCLDEFGGPNWVGNFVDAPIIVNNSVKNHEFYKQPMFYFMGHFSKFVRPGSKRIQSTVFPPPSTDDQLEVVAFLTPKGDHVLVVHNQNATQAYSIFLKDASIPGKHAVLSVEPDSIQTLVWRVPSDRQSEKRRMKLQEAMKLKIHKHE